MIVDRKIRLNIENLQFQNILNKLGKKIDIEELWILIEPSLENFVKDIISPSQVLNIVTI